MGDDSVRVSLVGTHGPFPKAESRNQHYLPRAVLRGFIARRTKRDEYAWVARQAGQVFCGNLEGIGAKRDFYSGPTSAGSADETDSLDARITRYETRLGDLLAELRATSIGEAANGAAAAEVISHLTPRGAGLRTLFAAGVESLANEAERLFTDRDEVSRILGLNGPAPGAQFQSMLAERLHADPRFAALSLPKSSFDRIAFALLRENLPGLLADQQLTSLAELNALRGIAPEEITRAHRNSLSKELVSEVRAGDLSALDWRILGADQAVLPDCVAIAVEPDGSVHPYLMSDRKHAVAVIMPLTPDRLLVGAPAGFALPSLSSFNELAAMCSDEFVVSATRNVDHLVSLIGTRRDEFLRETIKHAVSRLAPIDGEGSSASVPYAHEFSFRLSLPDWGDQEIRDELGETLKPIAAQLSRLMPLHRLDGFTFALEFGAELERIELGYHEDVGARFFFGSRGGGRSEVIPVLREGVTKFHVVIGADYGWVLLREVDQERRGYAVHVLVEELGVVAFLTEMEDRWPGVLLTPMADPHTEGLFAYAGTGLGGYMAARWSAGFGADDYIETELVDMLGHAVQRGHTSLTAAKEAYKPGEDIGPLYNAARVIAAEVLGLLGRWIGHQDGHNQPATADGLMAEIINALDLQNWFNLYASDLRRVWDRRGRWSELSEITDFGAHTERLLWQLGLFVTPMEDGQTWVEPFETAGLERALALVTKPQSAASG